MTRFVSRAQRAKNIPLDPVYFSIYFIKSLWYNQAVSDEWLAPMTGRNMSVHRCEYRREDDKK